MIVKLRRWFVCSSNKDESFNGGCEDDLFCLLLATPRAELNCEKKPGLAALDAESELDAVLRQLRAREARLYTGDLEKDIATALPGANCRQVWSLEIQTKDRKYFTITDKAPSRAFSWLKAPTSAFTIKTLC